MSPFEATWECRLESRHSRPEARSTDGRPEEIAAIDPKFWRPAPRFTK
jgi:hypothetical protein